MKYNVPFPVVLKSGIAATEGFIHPPDAAQFFSPNTSISVTTRMYSLFCIMNISVPGQPRDWNIPCQPRGDVRNRAGFQAAEGVGAPNASFHSHTPEQYSLFSIFPLIIKLSNSQSTQELVLYKE